MKTKQNNQHLLKRNEWYYYRRVTPQHKLRIALGVRDLAIARELRDHYDRVYEAERARGRAGLAPAPANETLYARLGLTRRQITFSTVADIFQAWDTYCTIEQRAEAYKTAAKNMALRIITLGAPGADPKAALRLLSDEEKARALKKTADVFTDQLVIRYRECRMLAVADQGALQLNQTLNSIESAVKQARGLFSSRALACTAYKPLKLPPTIADFMNCPLQGGEIIPQVALSVAVNDKLERGLALMKKFAPRNWLALVLGRELGLRRGEIVRANWSWVREVTGRYSGKTEIEVAITLRNGFKSKGNDRVFTLDAEEAAFWRNEVVPARLSPEDAIVPAMLPKKVRVFRKDLRCHLPLAELTPAELENVEVNARLDVCKRNVEFLRKLGIDADKPLHKMRSIAASKAAELHGLSAAQNKMGHGSDRTTSIHYIEKSS